MIGGRALVVTAVGQHLPVQLAGQPPDRAAQQPLVGEEDGQASHRLEPLDQVVAADVVLQVAAQETGLGSEPGDEGRLDVAAGHELAMQATPGPGAQRGRVRVPGIAAAEPVPGLPGPPQPGEGGPGGQPVRIRRQPPGPVPVAQVEAPEPGRLGVLPAARVADFPDLPEQPDLARLQLGQARPAPGGERVGRPEPVRPADRGGRVRAGQGQAGRGGEGAQADPLGAQPGPVRRLAGPQLPHHAAEPAEVRGGH